MLQQPSLQPHALGFHPPPCPLLMVQAQLQHLGTAPSLRRPRSLGWEQAKALPGCATTSLLASRWDLGTVIGSCAPSAEPGTHGHCLTQLHVWDFVLTFHFQGARGPLQLVLWCFGIWKVGAVPGLLLQTATNAITAGSRPQLPAPREPPSSAAEPGGALGTHGAGSSRLFAGSIPEPIHCPPA